MPLSAAQRKHRLKNLKGRCGAENWRDLYLTEKKESKRLQKNQRQIEKQLEELQNELACEREKHTLAQEQLEIKKSECESLKLELLKEKKKRDDVTDSLETSLQQSDLVTKELDLASSELRNMKTLSLLSARKSAESDSIRRAEMKRLSAERDRLSKSVEHHEEEQLRRVPQLGKYTALQSAYKQRKAVLQCERFMKGGACTGVDYSHLLRKIIAKADTTGESPCRLNPEQTFILRSAIHLSDGSMKTAKHIIHNFLGFDILSSREAVNAIKNDLDTSRNYKIEEVEKDKELGTGRVQKVRTIRITIKSMEQGIRGRLETLHKHGRLIDDGDDVILCLLGDKGSDETKLCVSIENTPNPNSPGNLLLVAMYDGQDSEQELRENASSVLKLWDDLDKISYTSADGTLVTKNVKKKVLGDMKIVSAYLGHRGHSSSHPCYDCLTPWSLHGTKALKLKDVDFSQIHTNRTLKTYAEDSKSGKNGVIKGSKPLCQVEPTDYGIPTVHVVMGLFTRYFENRINGEVNSMDRKDDQSAKTLREHKKSLAKMVKEETELDATLKKLVSARDDAFCTATAYRLVALNPLSHLKTPEPMCKSKFCVVNHLLRDRTTDNWIQCDVCEEYFHFACCSIFSPDDKLQITSQKSWKCCNCENWDKTKHHTKVLESLKALESEITKLSATQSSVTQKRIDLESLLFKSTGDNRKKLETFLFSINCDVRSWYQTLGGNQIRRLLRQNNIDTIFSILRDTPQNRLVKKAMLGLEKIMSLSDNNIYTDAQIDDVELVLKEFLEDMKLAFPDEVLIPKLHLLAFHLIPYMRNHHSWGRTSEQGIEHFHALFNRLKRVFSPVKCSLDRGRLFVRELAIVNWLYDTGANSDLSSFN